MSREGYDHPSAVGLPPVARHPDRACADPDVNPEIFYPTARGAVALVTAREVCGRCPHRQECLDWALETGQGFGIWSGTTPEERERMIKSREDA